MTSTTPESRTTSVDRIPAQRLTEARDNEQLISALLGRVTLIETWRQDLGDSLTSHVQQARAQGASWVDIGAALGMSKQAAQKRYGGQS